MPSIVESGLVCIKKLKHTGVKIIEYLSFPIIPSHRLLMDESESIPIGS